MTRSIRPLLLLLALLALPSPASAQWSFLEGWTAGALVSLTRGGPADDMETELRRQDWSDTSPGFFGPPIPHPTSDSRGGGWELFARYRAGRFLGAGLIHGMEFIASASGHRADTTFLGTSLFLDSEVRTTGVFGALHLTRPHDPIDLRIDAGLALYRTTVEQSGAGSTGGDSSDSRIGPFVGVGGAVKIWRLRFFLEGQRRFVGDVDYGPWELEDFNGTTTHTFEQASASFDYDALLFGIGFAL